MVSIDNKEALCVGSYVVRLQIQIIVAISLVVPLFSYSGDLENSKG